MKKLPQVNQSFAGLYRITVEPIRNKLLITGLKLKVFNQLCEERSANTVAEALETHPENTRLFLDGLTAGDLLIKKNGLYKNTPEVQAFLVEGSPTYVGELLISQSDFYDQVLEDIPFLIKNGPPVEEEAEMPPAEQEAADAQEGSEPEDIWKYASMGLAGFEQQLGTQIIDIVTGLPEFSSFKKMLDLGSGPGIFSIAFVSSHPKMRSVIFDRAEIVNVAEKYLSDYNVKDRIDTMAGDYRADSIGQGYDFIWACGSLNAGKQEMGMIVEKVYKALNLNGVFISFHDGLKNEQTKPDTHALTMTPMTLRGKDLCFEQGFIADHMLKAGFNAVRSLTLDTPYGPMDMDIGRKLKRA